MFLRKAIASLLVMGSLTALAFLAGAGLTGGGSSASAAYAYQYQYGVTICHHTSSASNPSVTLTVSANALSAFLAQGDTVGACS